MKLAVSNIALPASDQLACLPLLRPMGLSGLEVVPGRVWADGVQGLSPRDVSAYRHAVDEAGLQIVGFDGLLADHPELGLFKGGEIATRTADLLVQLSAVCRDLGGRTLIFGGERWRGNVPLEAAWTECRAFLDRLLPRIELHGTVLCFEPLGPGDGDFCTTARECRLLTDYMDSYCFGLHLNSKAQVENHDTGHAAFSAVRGRLEHFHANEPRLAELGSTGQVDHADFRRHLSSVSYRSWVVLKQRATPQGMESLAAAASRLGECYLRPDNLSMLKRMRG